MFDGANDAHKVQEQSFSPEINCFVKRYSITVVYPFCIYANVLIGLERAKPEDTVLFVK